jgi:3-phenylpropionate/cinnamic acid dioxygenase small subunit
MTGDRGNKPVETDLFMEIQRFLVDEAALLDGLAYREWFALLTEDISYRITTRIVRHGDGGMRDHRIVDEDFTTLGLRVDQLANPKLTLAEDPPSFCRRFITNIRADHGAEPDSYLVAANMLVYKNRPSNDATAFYVGERRDVLRRVDGALRIAARVVRLDESVLQGGTLSTLL